MTIACCFAILQALQPLIHAHLDGNHHSHAGGVHMAQTHEYAHVMGHKDSHIVSDGSHDAHTIAVPNGIKQDQATKFMVDLLAFVMVFCWIALRLVPSSNYFPQFTFISSSILRRRPQAPRAPPLF